MTRNTQTSPLSQREAQQQLRAIQYLNTGVELYAAVLRAQGFSTDTNHNHLIRGLLEAHGELVNHVGQGMNPSNDNLRFTFQAGVLPNNEEILRDILTADTVVEPLAQ